MQGEVLEELRHQHRQGGARIVGQIADQAAGGHIGAGLVQDVAGAGHVDIGARDFHIRVRAAIASADLSGVFVIAGLRGLVGQLIGGQRSREVGHGNAETVGRRQDGRPDPVARERRAGDGGHGGEHRGQGRRRIVRPRIEVLQLAGEAGDLIAGVREDLGLVLAQIALPDVLQPVEPVWHAEPGLPTDEDREAVGGQLGDDRLHPLAPGGLQDLGIQQAVGQFAEQVARHPAASGDIAIHAD